MAPALWRPVTTPGQVSTASRAGTVDLAQLASTPLAVGGAFPTDLPARFAASSPATRTAAAALASPRPQAPALGPGFEGLNSTQCGCAPPDVIDAVGPTQIVEMVNLEVQVYSKTGVALHGASASSFFGAGSDFLSDPRVLYDNASGRWFASIFDAGPSGTGLVRLAVSAGSDATGTWYLFTMVSAPSGEFPDQPILGASSDLVAFGGNMFSESTSSFYGAEYWVVDKAALLNDSAAAVQSWGPDPNYLSIHPVQSLGPTSTQYFVSTTSASSDNVTMLAVQGVPPSSTVTWSTLLISSYTTAPAGREPSGGTIDSADTRVQSAVWQNGDLWLAFDDQCTPTGDSIPRACARLVEIATGSSSVLQDFDYGLVGFDLYYPALSLDRAGDLTMVFGYSSSSVYPSIGVTGQAATDGAGTMQSYRTVHSGSSTLSCGGVCRYGDYFGAATDPTSSVVWVGGEFTTASLSWDTWIAPVVTDGPARADLSVAPGSVDLGQNVSVSLLGANVTCGVWFSAYCASSIPLGDGATASSPCSSNGPGYTVTHTFSSVGSYEVGLNGYLGVYSSSTCAAGTQTLNLSIVPAPVVVSTLPIAGVAASPQNGADVGQSIALVATVSGGRAPYAYLWSGLPAGCANSATAWVNCTASVPGSTTIGLNVTDSNGVLRPVSLGYTVSPALALSLAATRKGLDVGQSATFNATVTGGSGSYGIEWFGLPTGCSGTNLTVLTCAPTGHGSFSVTAEVIDSNGASVLSSPVAVVVGPALVVSVEFGASGTVGQASTLRLNVSGGTAPYTITWSGLPSSCPSASSATLSCTPEGSGTYTIHVVVLDAAGASENATGSWSVSSAPTGLVIGLTAVLAIVGATVAACLVVGLLLLRRRSRRGPA